jgi:hypothetical protein
LLSAPRTDPSEPDSGTRLPPWVFDDKAIQRRRMEVSDSGEKFVDQFRDPRPGHAILLAAPLKRASPEFDDPVAERRKGPTVGLHRIICEIAGEDLLQPISLLGNRLMPPLSHLGLHLFELGQQAVTPGFPFEQKFPIATDAADEGEAQKVESLRFSEPALVGP